MRRITVGELITLDGVIEAPNPGEPFIHAGWANEFDDGEVRAVIGESMAQADLLLMGRVSYQLYAATFAAQTGGFADVINGFNKIVFSTTLKKAGWANSTLVSGNVAEEVAKLKQQRGGNIGVSGSAMLVRTLLQAGLVDELVLLVHPVVLGSGKRLFDDMSKTPLELTEAKPLRSGVVAMTYHPGEKV